MSCGFPSLASSWSPLPIAASFASPCARPVIPSCSPCARPVVPTCSPCARPVVPTCSPCARPVVPTCSPCARPVIPTYNACARPVVPALSASFIAPLAVPRSFSSPCFSRCNIPCRTIF